MMPHHNEIEGSKYRSLTQRDNFQQLTPHNLERETHKGPTYVRGGDNPPDKSSPLGEGIMTPSLGEGKIPSPLETPSLTDQSHEMTPSKISNDPSHSHLKTPF